MQAERQREGCVAGDIGIKPATAADASAIGSAKCATGCKDARGTAA